MKVHVVQEKDKVDLIEMLNYFNLVTQDIDLNKQYYLILESGRCCAAAGGLEFHPPYALLRSVVVRPGFQGKGYATTLCEALVNQARSHNIHELYLLTESARGFFSKLGFSGVERPQVPELIRQTSQFSSLCPAEAVVMKKRIIP